MMMMMVRQPFNIMMMMIIQWTADGGRRATATATETSEGGCNDDGYGDGDGVWC